MQVVVPRKRRHDEQIGRALDQDIGRAIETLWGSPSAVDKLRFFAEQRTKHPLAPFAEIVLGREARVRGAVEEAEHWLGTLVARRRVSEKLRQLAEVDQIEIRRVVGSSAASGEAVLRKLRRRIRESADLETQSRQTQLLARVQG